MAAGAVTAARLADGIILIAGWTAIDTIVFGKYGAHPITSEGVHNKSDIIDLNDGSGIVLHTIDHKVVDGLG